jgi:hypothetical protein
LAFLSGGVTKDSSDESKRFGSVWEASLRRACYYDSSTIVLLARRSSCRRLSNLDTSFS